MSQAAIDRVLAHSQAGCRLRETFFQAKATLVADIARAMAVSLTRGGKILLCGNGGSAADCQHIAAEFVNRFKLERPPLPAIALTTDSSILTAIGNDYGFEQVFLKQVQALGLPGDVLVAISTSGGSPNVLAAMRAAKERKIVTVGFTGASGGAMLPLCDYPVLVPEKTTALIQEIHIAVGHMLCELVDYYLFEDNCELMPYLNEA